MEGDAGYGGVAMGEVTFGRHPGARWASPTWAIPTSSSRRPQWPDAMREAMAERMSQLEGGANVEFVTVVDRGHLAMRVIERGVGWTLACGTGFLRRRAVPS
jgi:hypothetical protein